MNLAPVLWSDPEPATTDAADAALERVGLLASRHRIAGTLSHGQLRQLEIAMALAAGPTVLLLDEPLAGMGRRRARGSPASCASSRGTTRSC